MSLDNITKEQFQVCRTVQEKEIELQSYKTENYKNHDSAIWGGLVTLASGTFAVASAGFYIPIAVLLGAASIVSGCTTYLIARDIVKNSKAMGGLEKELEQLKSKPEYKALEK